MMPPSPPSHFSSPVIEPRASIPTPTRDPVPMLQEAIRQWGGRDDLWVFGYASLIWRPDFHYSERRLARVHGWHRALKMWSRINRGTPECPGLVFGMLSGGSCAGMAFRIDKSMAEETLVKLWDREMMTGVYDPKWLRCQTNEGTVTALAFTLSRKSPSHTGELSEDQYRQIFSKSCGKYGSTLEYVTMTMDELVRMRIRDRALERLLKLSEEQKPELP